MVTTGCHIAWLVTAFPAIRLLTMLSTPTLGRVRSNTATSGEPALMLPVLHERLNTYVGVRLQGDGHSWSVGCMAELFQSVELSVYNLQGLLATTVTYRCFVKIAY